MQPGGSVAIEEARLFADAAAARGVAPEALLAAAGLAGLKLDASNARIPRATFDRLVEHAVGLSGDLHLGLHAAGLTNERLPEPLRYALAACDTLGDQLRVAARYARLLQSDAEVELAADATGGVRITHDLPASRAVARRHLAERWLGALVLLARRHAGEGFAPREVWLAHPAPVDTAPHERLFRAPLRFEQPVDALVLGRDALAVRVRDGDPGLQRVLEAHLATLLPAVQPADLPELVRRRVRAVTHGQRPVIGAVAAALAMSPRTLQRRLAVEGTSYRDLVSEVREDLARQHLTESRLSISEIAFVLGFADATAFHRAFKRWTRQTPRSFRRGAFGQQSGAPGQEPAALRE